MRFSIIVSACNVAPYLPRLFDSLKAQSWTDFEVLLVSEESTDETQALLRAGMAGDARFRFFALPRSGSASVSRNFGLEQAAGDYLLFVDGDDWIESSTLADFAAALEQYGPPDLITGECRHWQAGPDGKPVLCGGERPHRNPWRLLSGPETLTEFFRHGTWQPATWRNLYRREFLLASGLRQIPGRRHQDDEWTPKVFFAARRVLISGIVFYNYLKRENSVTTKRSAASVTDVALNLGSAFDFWAGNTFPPELARLLAARQYRNLGRFFAPHWRGLYDRNLRRTALRRAFEGPGRKKALFSMWRRVGPRHRLFGLLVLPALAADRSFALAEKWYDRIY